MFFIFLFNIFAKSFDLNNRQECIKYINRSAFTDICPFNVHLDLLLSQYLKSLKTDNLRLDTVCNELFKVKILDIGTCVENAKVLFIQFQVAALEEINEIFLVGLRLRVISQSPIAEQKETLTSGLMTGIYGEIAEFNKNNAANSICHSIKTRTMRNLDIHLLNWADLTQSIHSKSVDDKIVSFWIGMNLDTEISANQLKEALFLTVGKTSELDINSQLSWKSGLHDVAETIWYCWADVHLTTQLERKIRMFSQIVGAEFKEQVPYSLFTLTDGWSVAFKKSKALIQENVFVSLTRNPYLLNLYFSSALDVTGVPAKRPESQAQCGPELVKFEAYQSANEIMQFNRQCSNVNEAHLGTMGYPLDDSKTILATLKKMI